MTALSIRPETEIATVEGVQDPRVMSVDGIAIVGLRLPEEGIGEHLHGGGQRGCRVLKEEMCKCSSPYMGLIAALQDVLRAIYEDAGRMQPQHDSRGTR